MDIEFIEVDQNWQDEITIYWFSVNDENYGIADKNGNTTLLDCDGSPIENCNDHNNIKDKLMPLYREEMTN